MKKILKYTLIVIIPFGIPLYLLSKGNDKLQMELIEKEDFEKIDFDAFVMGYLGGIITLIILTLIFISLFISIGI